MSKRFQPLFDEKLMGVRHAENGWLYAIIENMDKDADEGNKTREVPFRSQTCRWARTASSGAVSRRWPWSMAP